MRESTDIIYSMFAIVTIAGKQYNVAKGDVLEVDRIDGKVGDTRTFDHVLLINDEKNITIGTPTVPHGMVTAKLLEQKKGEKISVRRYKSKVRYRKATGFRAYLTKIEIISINPVHKE